MPDASPSDIAYGLGALWIANESAVDRDPPRSSHRRTPGVQRRQRARGGRDRGRLGLGREQPRRNGLAHRSDARNVVTSAIRSEQARRRCSRARARSGSPTATAAGSSASTRRAMDVVRTIAVGSGPQSLASLDGRVWLSARETARVHRGGTLRLYDLHSPDSLDTGAGYGADWSVSSVSGDGLVGFKRVGGVDGGTLVPDLATSRPAPTDGGPDVHVPAAAGHSLLERRAAACERCSPRARAHVPVRRSVSGVLPGPRRRRRVLEETLRPLSWCRDRRPDWQRHPAPSQARPGAALQAEPARGLPRAARGLDDAGPLRSAFPEPART